MKPATLVFTQAFGAMILLACIAPVIEYGGLLQYIAVPTLFVLGITQIASVSSRTLRRKAAESMARMTRRIDDAYGEEERPKVSAEPERIEVPITVMRKLNDVGGMSSISVGEAEVYTQYGDDVVVIWLRLDDGRSQLAFGPAGAVAVGELLARHGKAAS